MHQVIHYSCGNDEQSRVEFPIKPLFFEHRLDLFTEIKMRFFPK